MIRCKSDGTIGCDILGHCECYKNNMSECCWCEEIPVPEPLKVTANLGGDLG